MTAKTNMTRLLGGVAAAVLLTAACLIGLAGCSGSGSSSKAAATVNGTVITEQEVTDYIQNQRALLGYDDEEAWADYLIQTGYTAEEIRNQVIQGMIQEELVRQGAKEAGVTIDESEIDQYIESARASYETDEEWAEALEAAGYTEASLRENYEMNLLQQAVLETLETDVSEEELLEMADMYASQYDGAKRSSHILFSSDDEATALEVLDKINSGEIDFETAAAEYSQDTGSAANGGDVGWDALTTFVTEYQDGFEALEVGQVSSLVQSDYGYHIIKVTDVFNAPETITSLDQLPEDFLTTLKESASQQTSYNAFSEWLQQLEDQGDVVIEEMPTGLPYDVDLSKYEADAEANAQDVLDDDIITIDDEFDDDPTNDDGVAAVTD